MLLATFYLEHEAVALADAFAEVPEMEVEAERIAAHSTEWTMPCLWVAHSEFETVDTALKGDPSVDTIIEMDEFDGEKYYHVEWSRDVEDRVNAYVDKEGSILRAEASEAGWRLRLRFVNRGQFDVFRDYLSDQSYAFHLVDITEPGTPRLSFGELTPKQRTALVTAFERGYYNIPRDATGQDLADELDTSPQALSELLRRGTANLIDGLLTTPTGLDNDASPYGETG